ncbi:MAG: trigger factor [Parvularculaceae bacterium]|nr:trigger factor [Parvularculaceae bacterium]
MEVIEKTAEGLERKFTVKVPAAELDAKLNARLAEVKGNVQLKGFRKGKAPLPFLKKMYGKGMMSEILQEIINETSYKAFSDRDLKPATTPHPHFSGDFEQIIDGKADLEYEVHAEILPSFEPMSVDGLKLKRPVAEVTDADVDEQVAKIAESNRDYEPRKKSEKAKEGDQLVIDFTGSIDGEEFAGGKGEDHSVVLGSNALIPGFEEQLIGAKADSDVEVKLSFPDDYGSENLNGKKAVFAVKVKEVKAPKDAAIDDEFAKKLGLDSLDELKSRVRERIEGDFKSMSRSHVKRALLDKLDDGHDFELPKSMVDAEFNQIWAQVENAERDEEDKDKSEDELKEEYRKIAVRRVRLGLVLAEIGRRADVQVPSEHLQSAVQQAALRDAQLFAMQGQKVSPQEVLKMYQQNPQAIAQIRAPLFEERVVDFILEKAEIADKKVSKDELMKDPEGDE